MIKKIICTMLAVFALCSVAYGDYNFRDYKLKDAVVTLEDQHKILESDVYKVNLDGKELDKTVLVNEYKPYVSGHLALRDFVEALGGTVTWNPNYSEWGDDEKNWKLGSFELFGWKYDFTSSNNYLLEGGFKDFEYALQVELYTKMDNKDVQMQMSTLASTMYLKLVDNRLYINVNDIRELLPRMGYLFNIDKENKVINIKKYDFEKEKQLMIEKFPYEKYGDSFYNKEYGKYEMIDQGYKAGDYSCEDMFYAQMRDTENMEMKCFNYIDCKINFGYVVNNDVDEFYKKMFYSEFFSSYRNGENVYIKYDPDLDAYILTNKDLDINDKLNQDFKILVLRKFDNVILYAKNLKFTPKE